MTRSRREVFETHADRTRVARCPVCRRAVEMDHDEALEMQAGGARAPSLPGPAPAQPEEQEEELVGFALV